MPIQTSIRKTPYALLLGALLLASGCQSAAPASTNSAAPQPTVSAAGTASPAPSGAADDSNSGQAAATPQATGAAASDSATAVVLNQPTAVRLASASSGWIGGDGWIARTDNGGKSWKQQYKGGEAIAQIFALNDKMAWAVTGSKQLLATTDGGQTWKLAGSVPNNGFLHFVSAKEAFMANATTKDGGRTWTTLQTPANLVGDPYFHDAANGWAVTQTEGAGKVERTTDGGRTWTAVMNRKLAAPLNGALIRSAGASDAWVEWIGDSGMTQTSYSLFHTADGGGKWQTVLANSSAGGGPAPGFPLEYNDGPKNEGSRPGPLYVVDRQTAFMGGSCPACDKPNTIGWTKDAGRTWVNGSAAFAGYGEALLAMADSERGWWITTDSTEPSAMYTTADGGKTWTKVYTFAKPKASS
ncbi:hypothetical protein B5M42_007210 [Paenibacillus athensensis]|uniref:Uncharacterized protein n=1 Tax=Paenibacillus athensensis TaxID=1967502 RepID=A0A4Y8Q347_9BACL|nr:YCF48-related protein [Paenibacillus athensensis]MCD1258620.1 hypothetical protein [Paenibacillus athensensis]